MPRSQAPGPPELGFEDVAGTWATSSAPSSILSLNDNPATTNYDLREIHMGTPASYIFRVSAPDAVENLCILAGSLLSPGITAIRSLYSNTYLASIIFAFHRPVPRQ
ncbi:hypothetical protein PLEOSDRAFT_156265 [Pleurotus ostreatus PC15]|uniref:Uncharacterized protein n=1 Tax=Pleurotus ostreatus (strain PC15) TaxID=1137138 RepID=A0A067NUK7_PLEO1|nr:hypothetical protein PLEOSDRAFT_156265 [Pleurotus ostreatus PC15]